MIDHLLHTLGAEIRRCHDCRRRYAAFAHRALPLGEPQTVAGVWAGLFVMGSGLVLAAWWLIRRLANLPG